MSASRSTSCPEPGDLARAVSTAAGMLEAAEPCLQAHLDECAACTRDWREQAELARLGPELPFEAPTSERQAEVRARLMERATQPRPWPRLVTTAPAPGDKSIPSSPSLPSLPAWPAWPPWPAGGRRRRLRVGVVLGGASALAAGVALFLASRPHPEVAPPSTGQVLAIRPPARLQASAGARFALESAPPHERVRLHQGALRVDVEPARHGETFRIVTSRGEVEVRGTVFDAEATADQLIAVRVYRGRVVVRKQAGSELGSELILDAGQDWRLNGDVAAPAAPAAVTRQAAPPRRPRPERRLPAARAAAPTPTPTGSSWRTADSDLRGSPAAPTPWPDDQDVPSGPDPRHGDPSSERAFGKGLQLLRGGEAAQAARAFEDAARLAPIGPLAEDAWYWRAVALVRAGAGSGRNALSAFIDRYPLSPRRAEASVILGWLLLQAGDQGGAEPRFRAGLQDRSARVRDSARAGLGRIVGRDATR